MHNSKLYPRLKRVVAAVARLTPLTSEIHATCQGGCASSKKCLMCENLSFIMSNKLTSAICAAWKLLESHHVGPFDSSAPKADSADVAYSCTLGETGSATDAVPDERGLEYSPVTVVFAGRYHLPVLHSFFPPSDYIASLVKYRRPCAMDLARSYLTPSDSDPALMRDRRLNEVFGEIQRLACLPSRESAIEFFWRNNQDEIDFNGVKLTVAFRCGYFIIKRTPEVEALKDGLVRTAERFLALRDELLAGVRCGWSTLFHFSLEARKLYLRDLNNDVFERCFKAIGLLASSSLTRLDSTGARIVDLSPLATLVMLKELNVGSPGNPFLDLTPLASLVNLKVLSLSTRAADLTPLASLVNLGSLCLEGYQGVDLTVLMSLVNLKKLILTGIREADLTRLAFLVNLKELHLAGDLAPELAPLATLVNLRKLKISGPLVADLAPLASLVNLTELDCSYTAVVDLNPMANLVNLRVLNLYATQVVDLTHLAALVYLRDLSI